jgi:hypothetical protein
MTESEALEILENLPDDIGRFVVKVDTPSLKNLSVVVEHYAKVCQRINQVKKFVEQSNAGNEVHTGND